MKIKDLIDATSAKVLKEINEELDVSISTDTRTIKPGDFYLPLKGVSFDGEKFIDEALKKGAVGAFCTGDNGTLRVEDTLEAYLKLANWRRNRLNLKVVAITGSSGKTTTKELVASVLGEKFKVFKTPLNHNNEVGLCQTIFSAPDDTEVLILEMGMRGLGEIELLSKYSEPDITIITNVGTAHIGRLGSRENIAKAKCEIVKYQRGNVFIAKNDELIKKTVDFSGEKIFYSIEDVKILEERADYSKFEYMGNIYELNVGGEYNIENSLSAIRTGLELGLTVQEIQSDEMSSERDFMPGFEFPSHYRMMTYTITPELPDGAVHVFDCAESDQPRQIQSVSPEYPYQPQASIGCAIGIIGGADGPTAIMVGVPEGAKVQTACSSLHFEPTEKVEWRLTFREEPCGEMTIKLI